MGNKVPTITNLELPSLKEQINTVNEINDLDPYTKSYNKAKLALFEKLSELRIKTRIELSD